MNRYFMIFLAILLCAQIQQSPIFGGEVPALIPETDLFRSLGRSNRRWNGVYAPFVSDGELRVSVSDIVITTDARLTDSRTPTAHAATHLPDGLDPLTLADFGGMPAAPATGQYLVSDGEWIEYAGASDHAALTGRDTADQHPISAITGLSETLGSLVETVAAKAPLASPAFTGNPTAPTQTAGNSSTRLATTAFVQTAIDNAPSGGGFNKKIVITESGAFTPSVSGWARVTCIGGGGSGGASGRGDQANGGQGGKSGGVTTFSSLPPLGGGGGGGGGALGAGGGGGAGKVIVGYLELIGNISVTIGAGGAAVSGTSSNGANGANGEGTDAGKGARFSQGGGAAAGAGNGAAWYSASGGIAGIGGAGGVTGYGYGGGGGGGATWYSSATAGSAGAAGDGGSAGGVATSQTTSGAGGAGAAGAVIIEYFDPSL